LLFWDGGSRGINGLREGDDKCICRLGSFPGMGGWWERLASADEVAMANQLFHDDTLRTA